MARSTVIAQKIVLVGGGEKRNFEEQKTCIRTGQECDPKLEKLSLVKSRMKSIHEEGGVSLPNFSIQGFKTNFKFARTARLLFSEGKKNSSGSKQLFDLTSKLNHTVWKHSKRDPSKMF